MISGDPGVPSLNFPRPAKQSTITMGCGRRWSVVLFAIRATARNRGNRITQPVDLNRFQIDRQVLILIFLNDQFLVRASGYGNVAVFIQDILIDRTRELPAVTLLDIDRLVVPHRNAGTNGDRFHLAARAVTRIAGSARKIKLGVAAAIHPNAAPIVAPTRLSAIEAAGLAD